MKTKLLPAIWYSTAICTFAAVYGAGVKLLAWKPGIAVFTAWLLSLVISLTVGRIVLKLKPELRFSANKRVDGLGFVHTPVGFVVYFTWLALFLASLLMFHRRF